VYDDAKLLVVFCSQSCGLPELLAQIRACSAGVPVIGCTTAGEIATSGPGEAGVGIGARHGWRRVGEPMLVTRRGVLGDQGIHTEIQRLAAIAKQAPVAGLYTYGEIARTRGMRGFHNQTLIVLSIS
jgi:hypothetical protein